MSYIIIVSYPDGSAIKGAYGPYGDEPSAKRAMKRLRELPGMGEDKWEIFPLHAIRAGSQAMPGTPQEGTLPHD